MENDLTNSGFFSPLTLLKPVRVMSASAQTCLWQDSFIFFSWMHPEHARLQFQWVTPETANQPASWNWAGPGRAWHALRCAYVMENLTAFTLRLFQRARKRAAAVLPPLNEGHFGFTRVAQVR